MDDNDVDVLLQQAGAEFRATHARAAQLSPPPSRRLLLPLAAAAATVAAVLGVAIAVPDRDNAPSVADPRPSPAMTPGQPSPSAGQPSPTPPAAPDTTITTTLPSIDDVEFNETWLALSGGEIGQQSRGRIELRRRADPGKVIGTITTSYEYGDPACLELAGNQLLWTDTESVVTDRDPGPPTRWSIWQRDLATGAQRRLASGLPDSSMDDVPCPTAGHGYAAWQVDGRVTVRDLDSGTETTLRDDATPVAITAAGLVEATWGQRDVQVLLRTGSAFATRRPVINVPGGTSLAVGEGRLLVFTIDPRSESSDAQFVSTCQLPECPSLTELRRDPGSGPGVVGTGFAAWNNGDDRPAVVRFDGGPTPVLAAGYVPFQTLAAFGDTFAYAIQNTDYNTGAREPATLHLVTIGE
jgi:hypothetical protein